MRGHWALIHPVGSVLTGLAETCIQEACWRSFLQGIGGVPFFASLHKGADSSTAGEFLPPPPVHTTSTGSTGLSPGIYCTLLTLCWETKQTFWQQHIWMCHLGGAAQPEQLMWAADNALCYHWWWGLWKNAKLAKNQSERMQTAMVCGHHLQDQSLLWSANCLSFLPQMINNDYFLLTDWLRNTVMIKWYAIFYDMIKANQTVWWHNCSKMHLSWTNKLIFLNLPSPEWVVP